LTRSIEEAVRRRGWPARGYYVDRVPPADVPAQASLRVGLGEEGGTLTWFVPFSPWAAQAEPPPEVAAAAVEAWRALGVVAHRHPGDAASPWAVQCHLLAVSSGPVAMILARQAHLGSGLRRLIARSGYLLCDGQPVMPSAHVAAGSGIVVLTPPETNNRVEAERGDLAILYEDDHLLVLAKPPGLLVHPARSEASGTLANLVAAHLAAGGVSPVVRPVGRLDRGTSGVALFAKSRYAHHALATQRRSGRFRRTYLAVTGPGPYARGDELSFTQAVVSPPNNLDRYSTPREAATTARVLVAWPAGLVLQVELATGRTHQIRQHLAGAGLWLWGDRLYGGEAGPIARPALHAWRVQFSHPIDGKSMVLHAAVPADLRSLLAWLRQRGA